MSFNGRVEDNNNGLKKPGSRCGLIKRNKNRINMLASGKKMRNTWTWEGGKAGNLKKK